jgi:hypothetical protein
VRVLSSLAEQINQASLIPEGAICRAPILKGPADCRILCILIAQENRASWMQDPAMRRVMRHVGADPTTDGQTRLLLIEALWSAGARDEAIDLARVVLRSSPTEDDADWAAMYLTMRSVSQPESEDRLVVLASDRSRHVRDRAVINLVLLGDEAYLERAMEIVLSPERHPMLRMTALQAIEGGMSDTMAAQLAFLRLLDVRTNFCVGDGGHQRCSIGEAAAALDPAMVPELLSALERIGAELRNLPSDQVATISQAVSWKIDEVKGKQRGGSEPSKREP